MKNTRTAPLFGASIFALAALLTACGGGGGGGGGTTPPTGGATPAPPAATPSPTPTPGGTGTLSIGSSPLANDNVVFTCGCNGDGGLITTDANGNYTITGSAPSVLTPGSTYTASDHNLMIVGYTGDTQVWTMMFLGNTPAHNAYLTSLAGNPSSPVTTAAALYVYYAAGTQISGSDKSFGWFNFSQIAQFANQLATAPDPAESKLLADVQNQEAAGASLYPGFKPTWSAVSSEGVNPTITADVQAIANGGLSADNTLPTPCPSKDGCSNAPTP